MPDKESNYRAELNERIDGGGCAETWEALSARRNESSQDRRSFLSHVATLLGTASAGGVVSSGTTTGGTGSEMKKRRLRGRERGQRLRRADDSDDVAFAADVLDGRPGVEEVFEYEIDGEGGRAVTFGSTDRDGTTIKHFEAGEETRVTGATPVGDGVRSVDAENRAIHDVGTQTVRTAVEGLDAAERVSTGRDETAEFETAVLVRAAEATPRRFDLFVPLVRGDEVVDRVVLQGTGSLSTPDTVEVLAGGGFATRDPVVCGPWGTVCTNYCTVLCGALSGLAGSACVATCSTTVAGIPISPACGAVCAGTVAGTCLPTCTTLSD